MSPVSTSKGRNIEDIMRSTLKPAASPNMLADTFYEEAESGTIRKLPLCGEKDASKPGYSMFEWHSKT